MSVQYVDGFDAIVSLSRNLLRVGLNDLLSTSLRSRLPAASKELDGSNIDPDILLILLYAVVNRQNNDILTTLFRMCDSTKDSSIKSAAAHEFWREFTRGCPKFAAVDHMGSFITSSSSSSSSAIISFVDIIREPLYSFSDNAGNNEMVEQNILFRKVVSKQGMVRGTTVLKETAYAFTFPKSQLASGTIRSQCKSSVDSDSSLLIEHIYLSYTIFQQRYYNPVKYRQFCDTLCSGSLFSVNHNNYDSTPRHDLCSYEPQSIFLMATICTIVCYLDELYSPFSPDNFSIADILDRINSASTERQDSTQPGSPVSKTEVIRKSGELLRILMKLPINTHAVTQVVQDMASSSGTSIVTTKVIGYAVFLHGSAFNHSCSPNAVVKYCGDSLSLWSKSNDSLDDSKSVNMLGHHHINAEMIRNLQMNVIISNSSVRYGEEITISYGVLAGKDPLARRQDVLRKQYLFRCYCAACRTEHDECEARKMDAVADLANVVSSRFVDRNTENVKEYCRRITAYTSELDMLNIACTELLAQSKHSIDPLPLQLFYNNHVVPFFRKVNELRDLLPSTLQEFWKIVEGDNSNLSKETLNTIDWGICREYCQFYCTLLDLSAHLESSTGQYLSAAEKIALVIRILVQSKLYGEEDIVVARERVKLGGLLFNAGEIRHCHDVIRSAMESLEIGVNEDDPDKLQAKQLLYFTARLLPM